MNDSVSSPNGMMYAPRKYRGLGLVCARSEVQLQHFAIAKRLYNISDELFHEVYDCKAEMDMCKEALSVQGDTVKELRAAVRDREFEEWSALSYAGIGVHHFKHYPQANRFVCNKNGLSGSEWTESIKLNCNYANLAGVPGSRTSNNRCRRCGGEKETIQHVLGACDFGSNRRTARHHNLKHRLAALLREKGLHTINEAACVDANGSGRSVDILAFDRHGRAFIIDPTIRYEANRDMDSEVQAEKAAIYEPCVPDLIARYRETFGDRQFEVIGVWMGARGTVGSSLKGLFERFDLPKTLIPELAEKVLSDSVRMIHNHIYTT